MLLAVVLSRWKAGNFFFLNSGAARMVSPLRRSGIPPIENADRDAEIGLCPSELFLSLL